MKTMILVAASFLLVSCAHTQAENSAGAKPHTGHPHGATCSCNGGKGGHSATNVTEHVDALFAKLDADGDKALTREEIGEHHLAKKFDQADADGDGTISREEMLAFGKKMHAMRAAKEAEAPSETPTPEAAATPAQEAPAAE